MNFNFVSMINPAIHSFKVSSVLTNPTSFEWVGHKGQLVLSVKVKTKGWNNPHVEINCCKEINKKKDADLTLPAKKKKDLLFSSTN